MKTDLGHYKNIGDYAPYVILVLFLVAVGVPLSKDKPWTKIGAFFEKVMPKEKVGR